MAKTDAKGRSQGDVKHVRIHRYMKRSQAYLSLTCVARCLLVELYDIYNGGNNGDVFLSCRDAAALLGLSSKDTASRAFRDLEDRGFIRVRGRSSFTMKGKMATTWVLTEFPFAGALATKDFMKWRPGNLKHGPTHRTDGPITGTVSPRSDRGAASQSDPSDRESPNQWVHGPITGTQVVYQDGRDAGGGLDGVANPCDGSPHSAGIAGARGGDRLPLTVVHALVGRRLAAIAA